MHRIEACSQRAGASASRRALPRQPARRVGQTRLVQQGVEAWKKPDPIAGNPEGSGRFSIPGVPTRTVVEDVPRFVTVKGGAYFFLPGREAIDFLCV